MCATRIKKKKERKKGKPPFVPLFRDERIDRILTRIDNEGREKKSGSFEDGEICFARARGSKEGDFLTKRNDEKRKRIGKLMDALIELDRMSDDRIERFLIGGPGGKVGGTKN